MPDRRNMRGAGGVGSGGCPHLSLLPSPLALIQLLRALSNPGLELGLGLACYLSSPALIPLRHHPCSLVANPRPPSPLNDLEETSPPSCMSLPASMNPEFQGSHPSKERFFEDLYSLDSLPENNEDPDDNPISKFLVQTKGQPVAPARRPRLTQARTPATSGARPAISRALSMPVHRPAAMSAESPPPPAPLTAPPPAPPNTELPCPTRPLHLPESLRMPLSSLAKVGKRKRTTKSLPKASIPDSRMIFSNFVFCNPT